MAHVLVIGAGINGLSTAMLLARAGHRVTVLERDPHEPPADADRAWHEWDRPGVAQFRHAHYLHPRWHDVAGHELPDLLEHLEKFGATPFNLVHALPARLTGGTRPGDERFTTVAARRPVLEAAVASCAATYPTIAVRRGVAVAGLTCALGASGVPHVTGVQTDAGPVAADLVVVATGRRSRLPQWLAAIRAAPPAEERVVNGFVYYGRYFGGTNGEALPPVEGPLLQHYAGLSLLTLPGDNGTWAVAVVGTVADRALRALRDPDTWLTAVRRYPLAAGWVDAEPLTGVEVLARLDDHLCALVGSSGPVVTGLVAVGDAWARTNPSLGRGMTMGLLHARALRDVLDVHTDPHDLVRAFAERTSAEVEPLYRSTLAVDGHRTAEIAADVAGERYTSDDPAWVMSTALQAAALHDPEALRASIAIGSLLTTPAEAFADPGLAGRVSAYAGATYPLPGPDRAELLAVLGS